MHRRSLLVASALAPAFLGASRWASAQSPVAVQGAGTSFLRPFYMRWGQEAAKEIGFQTAYEAASSDQGVARATQRTVDFGACETPLSPGPSTKTPSSPKFWNGHIIPRWGVSAWTGAIPPFARSIKQLFGTERRL